MLLTQTLNIFMLTSNHMFTTYGWNIFMAQLLIGSFKTTKNKVSLPTPRCTHRDKHIDTQQAGSIGEIPRPTVLRMCKYDDDLVQSSQRKKIEN